MPEVVAQILQSRKQDGSGKRYLARLRSVLNRFATAHPGQILDITSSDSQHAQHRNRRIQISMSLIRPGAETDLL